MKMEEIDLLFNKMSILYSRQLPSDAMLMDMIKNEYYRHLKDVDIMTVSNNYKAHVKQSNFLPTVADLSKPIEKETRPYIPTALETKQRALQLESGVNPASEEERKQALEDIKKKILEGKKEHEKRINRLFK